MKLVLAFAAVFVVWMGGSFLVHGMILHDDYIRLGGLMRPEEQAHEFMLLMILAHLVLAGAFVWIYSRGVEPKPWLPQGLRYGFAVSLLTVVPTSTIYYVVQPTPGALAVKQITFGVILTLLLGIVVAGILRAPKPA